MKPLAWRSRILNAAAACALAAGAAFSDEAPVPPPLTIHRAPAPIRVDGELSDPGWEGAARVDTWYETNPGDNTPPKVKNVGYIAYDDKFFYAGFEFHDTNPSQIRAPLGDHDSVGGPTDYGGVILDTRNDGRTAILFLANARGIQYDAVTDDGGNGEDSSPDYFWESAGRITPDGWTLELRIPFSTLRYPKSDPQTWGILLYRNHPREFRYQYFSTQLPRGGNCFICRENKLSGLSGLPSGGHSVIAPYVSGNRASHPRGDVLGSPLENDAVHGEVGLDVKWTPTANTALDATLNPDFSQIESDVAQIGVNERFALFFPEKRPFFLEGIDLFSTPIQAVYTRTITSPRGGVRVTGRLGRASYTGLFAQDRGGGSVILPGPLGSDLADQEFQSWVAIGRVRRDVGRSFVSLIATDREIEGDAHNRVIGPDFQWRPNQRDTVTGQFLFSDSRTPDRPDLAAEWDGRRLSGHAGEAWWSHSTKRFDWFTDIKQFSDRFRADDGFVPQVGYRETYGEAGYTFRPQGFVRRVRTYLIADRTSDLDGRLISSQVSPGFGLDARWNSFVRIRYAFDKVRTGDVTLPRQQLIYTVQATPSRAFSNLSLDGFVGEQIDFDNNRVGRGANVALGGTVRPTDHLELRLTESLRFLNVDAGALGQGRLFTAHVDRLRATYTFSSRLFVRAIAQWVETRRDPSLYLSEVSRHTGDFSGSALFAYKLNWQTVLFLGYGDERALTDQEELRPSDRQFFLKLSYAFQR